LIEEILLKTKKAHILFVSNTAFSMWNFRRDVMRHYLNEGYDVSCIAANDTYAEQIKNLGVNFYSIPISRSGTNPFSEIKILIFISEILKSIRPDVIVSYTIKPNIYMPILAKMKKIPCLAVVTGLGYAYIGDGPIQKIARFLLEQSLKLANHVWFLNTDDLNTVCRPYSALSYKSSVLPSEGINTQYFDDTLFPTPLKDKFIFLMISRIISDKGVYEYVESAKVILSLYKNVECHFLGGLDDGNLASITMDKWQKIYRESGIKYLKTLSDVRGAIINADVIVLPSYKEGIPLSLLEGGSMRRPLITTDIAGCRDIVSDNINGFLIPPRDSASLVVAMKKMIEMPKDDFQRMKISSREVIIQKFEKNIILKKYGEMIENLLRAY